MKTLNCTCAYCNKEYSMPVFKKDLDTYNEGKHNIQDCFPYLSSGYRELLISGMCPECWDKLYSEEENG